MRLGACTGPPQASERAAILGLAVFLGRRRGRPAPHRGRPVSPRSTSVLSARSPVFGGLPPLSALPLEPSWLWPQRSRRRRHCRPWWGGLGPGCLSCLPGVAAVRPPRGRWGPRPQHRLGSDWGAPGWVQGAGGLFHLWKSKDGVRLEAPFSRNAFFPGHFLVILGYTTTKNSPFGVLKEK